MEWHDCGNEDRTKWGSWRHYRPVFSDSKHKCEYVTLRIEVGSIRPLPDYEVIWTVPITERLQRP